MTKVESALKKLYGIHDQLASHFVEREEVIEGLFVSLIARQNVLLLGPPGTAKSMLINKFSQSLENGTHFEKLLTKFSTPEELFGPLSLKALKEDKYERITTSMLPEAKFVFLDEIWKANSSILNSLLSAINERIFKNGTTQTEIPLEMLVGASNEYPQDNSLAALYDRFMLKYWVDYVNDDSAFADILGMEDFEVENKLTAEDLEAIRGQKVEWSNDIKMLFLEVRQKLKKENFIFSDRKWIWATELVNALAKLNGRDKVQEEDLLVLSQCMWHEHKDKNKIVALIAKMVDPFGSRIEEFKDQISSIMQPVSSMDVDQLIAKGDVDSILNTCPQVMRDLKNLKTKANSLTSNTNSSGHDKVKDLLEEIDESIGRVQKISMRAINGE